MYIVIKNINFISLERNYFFPVFLVGIREILLLLSRTDITNVNTYIKALRPDNATKAQEYV